MKKLLIAIAMLASAPAFANGFVQVRGYTRSNGTYVAPHVRTTPDSYKENNLSYGSNSLNGMGRTNMGSHGSTYGKSLFQSNDD